MTYSDVEGGYIGTGNITTDPLFVNAAAGDLHLQPRSRCLGAGADQAHAPAGVTIPTTDLDGNTRPDPPSMGAYDLAATPATIKITSARMITGHKLFVTTQRSFGAGTAHVTLTLGLTDNNNHPVTVSQDLTTNTGDSFDMEPFVIDLQAAGVPRFTTNRKFTITASASLNNNTVSDSKTMVIFLPVVLVPGINGTADFTNGNDAHIAGGDGTFPRLENYLKTVTKNALASNGWLGEGYYLRGDTVNQPHNYPTLFTLMYERDNAAFEDGATKLANLLSVEVFPDTYANKVNIVTHSKGGLVARQFVVDPGNSTKVKELLMTVPPNLGSVEARLDNAALPTAIDYSNLYPLWPWLRQLPFRPFDYRTHFA